MPIDHLPRRLRGPAERLRAWALTDAALMVILGVGCVTRGVAYFRHDPSMSTGSRHPSEAWMSLDTWAAIWAIIGVVCVVSSISYRSTLATISLSAAVGLHVLWGGSLLSQGIWLYAAWYLLIAVLVTYTLWRGSRTELQIREVADDRDESC